MSNHSLLRTSLFLLHILAVHTGLCLCIWSLPEQNAEANWENLCCVLSSPTDWQLLWAYFQSKVPVSLLNDICKMLLKLLQIILFLGFQRPLVPSLGHRASGEKQASALQAAPICSRQLGLLYGPCKLSMETHVRGKRSFPLPRQPLLALGWVPLRQLLWAEDGHLA